MRLLPSANLSRSQHRDPPIVTTCTPARCRNVRKPGPRPMSTRSCPASTMDATIGQPSGHRLPRRIRPDTVPSTRHAMANQKRCGQEANHGTEGTRTSWIATTTKSARRDTPSPLLWVGVCGLANQGWLRRWQHCQRDRNHGSDQAATWCRSTVQGAPRRIALLRRSRSRVERTAKLHPLWQCVGKHRLRSLSSRALYGIRGAEGRQRRKGAMVGTCG